MVRRPLHFHSLGMSVTFQCSDEDVKTDFATRQVYKIPANARMFILERLENRDNNERHDIVKGLSEKKISIEHIMPQTLSDQ